MKKRASAFVWVLVFVIVNSMVSAALAQPVQAKSVRAATVVEVNGNVTYTKSGGSKSHRAYSNLNLNQGDSISTGPSASVVLRIVDRNDELTIGSSAEVYIADLLEEAGGKKSKVKTWAGSMWTKVKSLVSSEDEFEVETPTAVMGVRGTQYMTIVDPITGRTTMYVAAGIVRATTIPSPDREGNLPQGGKLVSVYPAQQINLDSSTDISDLRLMVDYVDVQSIIQSASPRVLEAFIRSIPEIQQENNEIKRQLQEQYNQGIQRPDKRSSLLFPDQDELDKVKKNFDNVLPHLAKAAVDEGKVNRSIIDDVNGQIDDPAKKLDLTQLPMIDSTAGLDPEIERIKQGERSNASASAFFERNQMEQNRQSLSRISAQLERDMNRLAEANQQAEDAANQRASEALMSAMTPSERQEFLENQMKNEEQINPTAPMGGGGSSGGGGSVEDEPHPVKPVVSVKQNGLPVNGSVNVDLEMQHFKETEPFYAVEAHLVYNRGELNYVQTTKFNNAAGTVFQNRQAAETVTQHSGETQKELIYAASQYENSPNSVDNIKLDGNGLLARIPLQVMNLAGNTAKVELAYVKVVNKEGHTVYEMTAPYSITITTK
ncbi:FecR family protein [Paenibacillus sp. PvR148]